MKNNQFVNVFLEENIQSILYKYNIMRICDICVKREKHELPDNF